MKHQKLLCLLFLFVATIAKANTKSDTTFVDSAWHKIPRAQASFYKLDTKDTNDSTRLITRVYDMKDRLRQETPMLTIKDEKSKKKKRVRDGLCKEWYDNGQLKYEAAYRLNKMNGMYTSYWENGNLKRKENFTEERSKGGECYNNAGKKILFFPYYQGPQYRGGLRNLFEFIEFNLPYKNKENNPQNSESVTVQFIVTKSGTLKNLKVTNSTNRAYEAEALRVISLTKYWIPAFFDGEPIDHQFGVDVPF